MSSTCQSGVDSLGCDASPLKRSAASRLRVARSADWIREEGRCSTSVGHGHREEGASAAWAGLDLAGLPRPVYRKGTAKFAPSFEKRRSDAEVGRHYALQESDSSANVHPSRPISEKKSGANHCERHARDFSDCMFLHFKRPLQLSPLQAILNTVKEGLEGTPEGRRSAASPLSRQGPFAMEIAEDCVSSSGRGNAPDFGDSDDEAHDDLGRQGDENERGFASERKEGKKRELVKQGTRDERIVKRRTPVELRSNEIQGDHRVPKISVSTVQELAPSIMGLEKLSGAEDMVSGSRDVVRANSTHSMDGKSVDMIAPSEMNRSATENSNQQTSEVMSVSRVGRRAINCSLVVSGMHPSLRLAENCSEVRATTTGPNLLDALGPDVLLKVLSLLDARSLARCGVLSKHLKEVAHNDSLWVGQCLKLWEEKVHVPTLALEDGLPKVVAYSRSVRDATRTNITSNDLSEHNWEFRFTSAAPPYWRRLDPAHRGEAPMKRYFHKDGSLTAAPGDEVWGGHECFYSIVNKKGADGNLEHFVQINNWPCMAVSRTSDWGWILSNTVHVYQSIPDAACLTRPAFTAQ